MKKILAKMIVNAGRTVGLFHIYGFLRSHLVERQVAIIAYHRIDEIANQPWSITPITPQEFGREIRYLHQNYEVISLEQLCTALPDLSSLPANSAVVTIDDGYRDSYVNAYPIFRKYRIPATVFLVTGHISTGNLYWWDKVSYVIWETKLNALELDKLGTYKINSSNERRQAASAVNRRLKEMPVVIRDDLITTLVQLSGVTIPSSVGEEFLLSWDEIKEMSQNGISFGAHTVSHPVLTKISLEVARNEILSSKEHIEKELNKEVRTFCYPNGGPGDFNNDIVEILKMNGFMCAVTLAPSSFVSAETPVYRLPRITGASSFSTFEVLMSGLYLDFIANWKRLAR